MLPRRFPRRLPTSAPRQVAPAEAQDARTNERDVVIAGAGPVGLLLANLLGRRGLRVLIAERRTDPPPHSMAIGITPPSLKILQCMGLDGEFTRRGIAIETARVFENRVPMGRVDFSQIRADHHFILSLPQSLTVRILQRALRELDTVHLVEGIELTDLQENASGVTVTFEDGCSGVFTTVNTSYLVGCDGHRSTVRRRAGLRKTTRTYPCRFFMADFDDDTDLGREAHLYFGRHGSVESFPLPGGKRRWVVLAGAGPADPGRVTHEVIQRVRERVGHDLSTTRSHSQSEFVPTRARVRRYVRGRVVLCGDAAHVMSPIGGQGMNTGFADAAHLDRALACALENHAAAPGALSRYHTVRSRAFDVAATRAERGMWLGTRVGPVCSRLRRAALSGILLRPPIRERLAACFAMLTLPGGMPPARPLAPGKGTMAGSWKGSPRSND